jgi:hypothetical protein
MSVRREMCKAMETVPNWEFQTCFDYELNSPALELYHTPTWLVIYESLLTWKLWFYIPGYYTLWSKNIGRFEHKRKYVGRTPVSAELIRKLDPDYLWEHELEKEDESS